MHQIHILHSDRQDTCPCIFHVGDCDIRTRASGGLPAAWKGFHTRLVQRSLQSSLPSLAPIRSTLELTMLIPPNSPSLGSHIRFIAAGARTV